MSVMPPDFDPYFKWLAIPPSERPPNHYRLLGLPLFVGDLDVIADAADRQMGHIKSKGTGPYSIWSEKILTELAAARTCLLNPERKAEYDARLLLQMPIVIQEVLASANGPTSMLESAPVTIEIPPLPAISVSQRPRSGRHTAKRRLPVLAYLLFPLLGVLSGFLILRTVSREVDLSNGKPRTQDTVEEAKAPQPASPLNPIHPKPVDRPAPPRTRPAQPDSSSEPEVPRPIERPRRSSPRRDSPVTNETIEPQADAAPAGPQPPSPQTFIAVDLPSMRDHVAQKLVDLPAIGDRTCDLRLVGGQLNDEAALRFEIRQASSESKSWAVWLAPMLGDASTEVAPLGPRQVAEISITPQGLMFAWTVPAEDTDAELLRGCLMILNVGEQQTRLALRTPQALPDLNLELEQKGTLTALPIESLSGAQQLKFEILTLENFPASAQLPAGGRIGMDEFQTITFADVPLELRLKFFRRNGEPTITVSAGYTFENRQYPLSRLRQHQTVAKRELAKANLGLKRLQAYAQALPAQLEVAQRAPVFLGESRDATQLRLQRSANIARVHAEIAGTEEQIRAGQNLVAMLEANLKTFKSVATLVHDLGQRGQIRYRVFQTLTVGDQSLEVDLVRSRGLAVEPDKPFGPTP